MIIRELCISASIIRLLNSLHTNAVEHWIGMLKTSTNQATMLTHFYQIKPKFTVYLNCYDYAA